jgi:hypothetical protein
MEIDGKNIHTACAIKGHCQLGETPNTVLATLEELLELLTLIECQRFLLYYDILELKSYRGKLETLTLQKLVHRTDFKYKAKLTTLNYRCSEKNIKYRCKYD